MRNKKLNIPNPKDLTKIEKIDENPDFRNRYEGFKKLNDISLLSNIKKVSCFSSCFALCENLENITPLANIDVSNCADFSYMFLNCKSLKDISCLSNWKISPKARFKFMFKNTNIKDFSPLKNWFCDKTVDEIKKIVCE